MVSQTDDQYYERADAHIDLANAQLADVGRGKVSSSFMYAVARFNAWVTACKADSADDLRAGKEESIEYFVGQYRAMLNENLDDYIGHFEKYMRPKANDAQVPSKASISTDCFGSEADARLMSPIFQGEIKNRDKRLP